MLSSFDFLIGRSCLGPSFMWAELFLDRVVLYSHATMYTTDPGLNFTINRLISPGKPMPLWQLILYNMLIWHHKIVV